MVHTGKMLKRPLYEALDGTGRPYVRQAQEIGELPHADVDAALTSATQKLSGLLGLPAVHRVQYGAPVFMAFGLNLPKAKNHAEAKLLLSKGHSLSLDVCPAYSMPSESACPRPLLASSRKLAPDQETHCDLNPRCPLPVHHGRSAKGLDQACSAGWQSPL